jgi:hypothetical protein
MNYIKFISKKKTIFARELATISNTSALLFKTSSYFVTVCWEFRYRLFYIWNKIPVFLPSDGMFAPFRGKFGQYQLAKNHFA